MQQPLLFYRLTTNTSGVRYAHTAGEPSESVTQGRMATAGRLQNLSLWCQAAPGGTGTYTFTLRRNGANTALSCAVSGAAQTCQSAAAVDYNAGDLLNLAGGAQWGAQQRADVLCERAADGQRGQSGHARRAVVFGFELGTAPASGNFCGLGLERACSRCGARRRWRSGRVFVAPAAGTLKALAVH